MTRTGLDGTDELLRELGPRVLGALARRCRDFGAAEDAVQEALLAAHTNWPRDGRPDNPAGWLYQTASRRLVDHFASERARSGREQAIAGDAEWTMVHDDAREPDDELQHDETLRLLFTCCHPALSRPSAVALTLRAVAGLDTAAIAAAFLVPEATMAQRISRAKQGIRDSAIAFELPAPGQRQARLAAVLHVIYLVFTEGHVATGGRTLARVELTQEAIRLARALHRTMPDDPEVEGLLALLLLTDARRDARTGSRGELIPLDEQDRTRWNQAMIAEGSALVTGAFQRGHLGAYSLQAAIASLHAEMPSFAATDWPQILALYDVLRRLADNPMVELSRVVALAMVHGPEAGLRRLDELAADVQLQTSHRLAAVRAHLLERHGDVVAARREYLAAAAKADNLAEREHLLARAARLQA